MEFGVGDGDEMGEESKSVQDGVQAADDETGAALFDATQEILGGAGLPAWMSSPPRS